MSLEFLIEKLRKIKCLADSGVDGERDAASEKLRLLCAKHGVRLEDLGEQSMVFYKFRFRGKSERELFQQCLVFVCQSHAIRNRTGPGWFACELTPEQAVRVGECWEHYRAEWRRERAAQERALLSAMVVRHGLFDRTLDNSGDDGPSPSMDQLNRIRAMMAGLGTEQWSNQRRIE